MVLFGGGDPGNGGPGVFVDAETGIVAHAEFLETIKGKTFQSALATYARYTVAKIGNAYYVQYRNDVYPESDADELIIKVEKSCGGATYNIYIAMNPDFPPGMFANGNYDSVKKKMVIRGYDCGNTETQDWIELSP